MANQRDIKRWKKGRDHWNKWAEGRLKAKAKLEKDGKWAVDEDGQPANQSTQRWIDGATSDFTKHTFKNGADFSGFLFPWMADFQNAEFEEDAWFHGTPFCQDADYRRARFKGNAGFENATFLGETWFIDTVFEADARLDAVNFCGNVWFRVTCSPISLQS